MLRWNVGYPIVLLGLLKFVSMQLADGRADSVDVGDHRAARPDGLSPRVSTLAEASVLMLLIVSVAVHVVMVGLGLLVFGAEGSRTPPFSDGTVVLER